MDAFSDKELLYLSGILMNQGNFQNYNIAEQVNIKIYHYGYEIFSRYDEILTEEEKAVFLRAAKKVEDLLGKKILH